MTSVADLEHMLYVEKLHTRNFAEWAERATDPLAKISFRIAADREANHVQWVELMLAIAKDRRQKGDLGVSKSDLEFWIADEGGESDSYRSAEAAAEEPWVKAAIRQMAADEKTNAELLRLVLANARAR